MFSAVTLGGYNNFVSGLSGIGQCRKTYEHCGPPAPENPCSNKPGTIFWPSSGGCVPPFCPPGAKSEIKGARLNSGDCGPPLVATNGSAAGTNPPGVVPKYPPVNEPSEPTLNPNPNPGRGPLDIPEAEGNEPVVHPGDVPIEGTPTNWGNISCINLDGISSGKGAGCPLVFDTLISQTLHETSLIKSSDNLYSVSRGICICI